MPRSHALRMTRQRKIILEALKNVEFHPTADQVYEVVRQRLPRISLGTVYRNLEILSTTGMIRKLELGGSQRRFDWDMSHHYHVRCLDCGRVDDVKVKAPMTVAEVAHAENGYEVIGHRLEFIGICPACKRTESASRTRNRQERGKENGRWG